MQVQPYLIFDGSCEEALDFYRRVLGAEVQMFRFKEMPDPQPGMVPPGSENKIMHARLQVGDTVVMASDGDCKGQGKFQGFMLSVTLNDEAGADRIFNGLSEGGTVQMPLAKTFWSPRFGMLTDRFGVGWMVNVETGA